ncbi:NfeD family protein [Candidatus Bipolaricaulota bacterium]|nr:NfeD family protein [Candidatus Bipolaricaulota bacterium]
MTEGTKIPKTGDTSAKAYFFREAIEVCLVLAGLTVADILTHVPLWLWIALPSAKLLVSILFFFLFVKRVFKQPPRHGPWSMIGRKARTLVTLNPSGQVKVDGEIWSARTRNGDTIPSDQYVIIRDVQDRLLLVESTDEL